MKTPTLDCQACGDVLRELTPVEAQVVSLRPYDFIVYCRAHSGHFTEKEYR